ncbi:hypothetical protein SIL08_19975 [Scandinavium sp. V105_16]|uniref:Uncharacterized protein n=1 Tax=Scandinavium lactucae TaxID=3095028 RepID=A0AAJ2SBN2_9ENTR|nr:MULTISPECIES: hypothetical protein [unclassified Scandinavium]MDX6022559.1 hypothetical protein [Scandinavium sp. V105_16]MDX6033599.1 hypothetical protein [Scandinavium sp. V105_12]
MKNNKQGCPLMVIQLSDRHDRDNVDNLKLSRSFSEAAMLLFSGCFFATPLCGVRTFLSVKEETV